jgi:outer membrane autotransporter protein
MRGARIHCQFQKWLSDEDFMMLGNFLLLFFPFFFQFVLNFLDTACSTCFCDEGFMLLRKSAMALTFNRTLLAVSVCVVSPVLWADDCMVLDSIRRCEKENLDRSWAEIDADVTINGRQHTVDNDASLTSYSVINRGVLNVINGSVVGSILSSGSTINVYDSAVVGRVGVGNGRATITRSTIRSSDSLGLQLLTNLANLDTPVVATVVDSIVSGVGFGASVGPTGVLNVSSSSLTGEGYLSGVAGNAGLRMTGGAANISNGSRITGAENGISIITGESGKASAVNQLNIEGSTILAGSGAAIKVDKVPGDNWETTTAKISISDGTILKSGNGHVLEANSASDVDFKVDKSQLSGDLVADNTSTLDVTLRNHARLNGNIINGNSLTIDSSGHWQLGADNTIKSLAMDGGSVGLSEEAFHTLTVGTLSGRGVFDMRINLDNATGDLLNVTGEATGKHQLNVRNTGVEVVPEEFEALRVVHTAGGDAQFGLTGGRADLGVYSYALEQQGTDWFIVGSGKTISPSTQSALALFNVGPTIWNSELTTLRSRMGEVRGQEQGGGWIRSYGNRFKASLDSGVNYQQKQHGLSFGADAPVPVSNGHLLVGLMGGYSKSDLDLSRGSSGEVDSYYVGAYGTWLSEEGYYLDGVLKLNKFHNASKVAMSDGKKAKGDYSNTAVGGSVEFGKHIKLPDDYFIEPYAQLSSVWIGGDSYTLDNGLQANTSQTQSVLGKVGATVGRQFALKDGGVVQPYVRVAGAHEFSRSNDVKVNDQRFDNDLFGSRAELGAGVSVSLSERLQVHADFDYMKGEHVEQPWGANLGLRLAF